jgi:hypothetical protein
VDYLIAKGANTVALENIAAQEAMRTVNDSPPCQGNYQTTMTPEPQVRVDTTIADIDMLVKITYMSYTFRPGSAVILTWYRTILSNTSTIREVRIALGCTVYKFNIARASKERSPELLDTLLIKTDHINALYYRLKSW